MTSRSLDVVAIGDAIVDVIATTTDEFIQQHGLRKGSMRLLSAAEADELYDAMGPAREVSGGSAANSMAGVAALGLRAAFVGQVANDQLGQIFTHDMRSLGVRFDTAPLAAGLATGRCLILVTPDAQRTMNTCPGASYELTVAALDDAMIASAAVTFLEGYLWGPERPRQAMLKAAQIAHEAGNTVAFTLSESLCIGDRREGVLGMIDNGVVDILFGNEDELLHLTGRSDLSAAIEQLRPRVRTLVATRGAAGAMALSEGKLAEIAAAPVEQVVDTTGAGDLFAAGFLSAWCRGRPIEACLQTGARAAADVISRFGARPDADLKERIVL
ncbi:adenosine kinase [Sphingomonas piscis]|uniref:Adenosine kinase n=1 Tax=Sphingomonas piscis TaxID=2714943 RepID=A0A6G7YLS1_9SPHN|nr:adenosine kinase [Sphingomonas piscis]QIK77695.1 adenosine kinase [Sphingomonas piscis]